MCTHCFSASWIIVDKLLLLFSLVLLPEAPGHWVFPPYPESLESQAHLPWGEVRTGGGELQINQNHRCFCHVLGYQVYVHLYFGSGARVMEAFMTGQGSHSAQFTLVMTEARVLCAAPSQPDATKFSGAAGSDAGAGGPGSQALPLLSP